MATTHIHRPIDTKTQLRAWTRCITPVACAARPERQWAHGSHLLSQACRCGATRWIEANAGPVNKTRWDRGTNDARASAMAPEPRYMIRSATTGEVYVSDGYNACGPLHHLDVEATLDEYNATLDQYNLDTEAPAWVAEMDGIILREARDDA